MSWQAEWGGQKLYNIQVLVCPICLDVPQEQFRTIILPPDPPSVINARVPNFGYEERLPLLNQFIDKSPVPPTTYAQLNPTNAGPVLILCDESGTIALSCEDGNTQPVLPS